MGVLLWTAADDRAVRKIIDPIKPSLKGAALPVVKLIPPHLVIPGPGDVVVAMGNKALDVLRAHQLVPKARTLTFLREKPIPHPGGGHWLLSNDPAAASMDAAVPGLIQWDVQLANRLSTTGSLSPEIGQYAYVKSFEAVRAYVEQMFAQTGKPVVLSLDLETMGLSPYHGNKHILTVSITVAEGHSDVVDLTRATPAEVAAMIEDLRFLLASEKVRFRGANFKYDLTWMWVKWGLVCTNFTMDTTLVGSILDENRSNSLNTHAKTYTSMGGYDDPFNDKNDKAHMEVALAKDPAGFLTYCGGDTDACLRTSNVMVRDLSADKALQHFYVKVLHPAARAFEKIEARGVIINQDRMAALRKEVVSEIQQFEAKALALLPRRLRLKHAENLSLTKPSLLRDFFFTPLGLNLKPKVLTDKAREPSTAKDHLLMFSEVPEAKAFVDAYSQWGGATKTLSTFMDGFMAHLQPDGRFHPTYFLFAGQTDDGLDGGTNTGRLSTKGPPMQIVPKHTAYASRLRKCFDAPPGHAMFEVDVDQGELKIAADVSNDETMLGAYAAGRDLHIQTGGYLAGIAYEIMLEYKLLGEIDKNHPNFKLFKSVRQRAKAANFGLIYRISVEGYMEFARKTYGVHLTLQEATEHHKAFFVLYDKLHPWHDEAVGHARRYEWVRSPMGRVRHLPLINSRDSMTRGTAERQAINAPIQSCLSDMVLYAIGILSEQYPDLWMAGMTHDAIYGYVPEDDIQVWMQRISGTMENLPLKELGWEPKVKFTVSPDAGPDWASLEEVHL